MASGAEKRMKAVVLRSRKEKEACLLHPAVPDFRRHAAKVGAGCCGRLAKGAGVRLFHQHFFAVYQVDARQQ